MNRAFFTETQKYQQLWLWIIVLDVCVCGAIIFAITHNADNMQILFVILPIVILAFGGVIWILTSSRLETSINNDGIYYRFPVFYPRWKIISKDDIQTYAIQRYDAIFQYGGWGMKKSSKNGKSITIQGDLALLIELKNGERILLGTQNKDGIIWAMNRLMNNS